MKLWGIFKLKPAKRFIVAAAILYAVTAFCMVEAGTGGGVAYKAAAAFSLCIAVVCTVAIWTADLPHAKSAESDEWMQSIK